jgi:hypothetical protein
VPLARVTYEPSDENFSNPERGFFVQPLSDSASPSPLWPALFDDMARQRQTLLRRVYALTTFKDRAIDDAFLAHMQQDMDLVRARGVKVILLMAYTFNEPGDHSDAPLQRVLGHIDQLAPFLRRNADVIAMMDAGFIGRWGEWHTSSNGLDTPANRNAILGRILSALPAHRAVTVRTLRYKREMFGTDEPLPDTEAFSGSDRARVGHVNDCFVADVDDWGTYWPIDAASLEAQKDYLSAETRYVPQQGETCNFKPPRSDCPAALADLSRMHWSALNAQYHPDVLSGWKQQGCYDTVARKLGYRFELVESSVAQRAPAGGTLRLSFVLRNVGWASPYNERPIEVRLRHRESGAVTALRLDRHDPRRWLPGQTHTIQSELTLPSDLAAGAYDVHLALPDAAPLLASRPAYAIRLANKALWRSDSGDNALLQTVEVTR